MKSSTTTIERAAVNTERAEFTERARKLREVMRRDRVSLNEACRRVGDDYKKFYRAMQKHGYALSYDIVRHRGVRTATGGKR